MLPSMATDIRHPLFARFFDRLSRIMERDIGPHRDDLLRGLTGRVVEIGPGSGANFPHYPDSVNEVIALEPEPYLRAKAQHAAQRARVNVTVRAGAADELGLPDASCDAAVTSLVLCSVPDQATALAELRRVLRPGGELRFLEHVRSPHAGKARLQLSLDRAGIWPRMAGGCHCGRDTVSSLRVAGFEVAEVTSVEYGPSWLITNPHVVGRAVR
jgi:ubiquinone/menaquinone biosynthesis C-methylase UbiE